MPNTTREKKGIGRHPILFGVSVVSVAILVIIYFNSGGNFNNAIELGESIVMLFRNSQILEALITLLVLLGSVSLLVLVVYGLLCVVKNGVGIIEISSASESFGKRIGGIIKSLTEVTVGSVDTVLRYVAYIPSFFEALISLLLDDDINEDNEEDNEPAA
ncbi:hypothetical protein FACS18949_17960 [Clostridia bacterium]|nr:hypothetical protein FACS18949_17960 [Clostridia bacterium]